MYACFCLLFLHFLWLRTLRDIKLTFYLARLRDPNPVAHAPPHFSTHLPGTLGIWAKFPKCRGVKSSFSHWKKACKCNQGRQALRLIFAKISVWRRSKQDDEIKLKKWLPSWTPSCRVSQFLQAPGCSWVFQVSNSVLLTWQFSIFSLAFFAMASQTQQNTKICTRNALPSPSF